MSGDIEARKTSSNESFIKDGWFHERNTQWPGQAMALQIKKVLHEEQSQYQDVLVFESMHHGIVLVLDGAIQCTQHDEFSYQEMITHLGMMSHPCPRRVLVIGGGDGGVLREVIKHPSVEEAVLCDIDEAVTRVSKQFLPQMAVGFDSPKVQYHFADGLEFIKQKKNYYDVIITDSSDPEGPARALFEAPYFKDCYAALTEGGIFTNQAENFWLNLDFIAQVKKDCEAVFPRVAWATTSVPTYPSGCIGFLVASKDSKLDVTKPLRTLSPAEEDQMFQYYNADAHTASFHLPTFARKRLCH